MHIGELGGEHREILDSLSVPSGGSRHTFGFVDEGGKFLDRKLALTFAKQHALLEPWVSAHETQLESDFLKAYAARRE